MQPVFEWLRKTGSMEWEEMLQIFNCGIGYVFIVAEQDAEETLGRLRAVHEAGAWDIGVIERRRDGEEAVKVAF